jgi:hypothetical protein
LWEVLVNHLPNLTGLKLRGEHLEKLQDPATLDKITHLTVGFTSEVSQLKSILQKVKLFKLSVALKKLKSSPTTLHKRFSVLILHFIALESILERLKEKK